MNFSCINRSISPFFNVFENYFLKSSNPTQKKIAWIALGLFSFIASGALFYRYHFQAQHAHSHSLKNLLKLKVSLDDSKENALASLPVMQISTLILHLDVNRTLIADDKAAGFSLQDTLAMILAENCISKWCGQEISFHAYICLLIPGSSYGPHKKQRQVILKDFVYLLKNFSFQDESTIDFKKLKERDISLKESIDKINRVKRQVLDDLKKLQKEHAKDFKKLKEEVIHNFKLMEANLLQEQNFIFPSFFRLIEWLKELREKRNIDFHLILRTFGDDAPRIIAEATKRFPNEKFTHQANYLNGKWQITSMDGCQIRTLEKAKDVYRFLKSKDYQHLSIKDDWNEWNAQQEHEAHGKRFFVKLESQRTFALIIDDNIVEEPHTGKNIITTINVQNEEFISSHSLVENKIAVRTDTMAAILDHDYFIKVVKDSLRLNGKINA